MPLLRLALVKTPYSRTQLHMQSRVTENVMCMTMHAARPTAQAGQ